MFSYDNNVNLNPQIDKVCESFVNPAFLCDEFPTTSDSTKVGFYMDFGLVFMNASCNGLMLANLLHWYNRALVAVIHRDGMITGIVTREYLDRKRDILEGRPVGDVVIPWKDVPTAGTDESIELVAQRFDRTCPIIVVLEKDRPVGVLWPGDISLKPRQRKRKEATAINKTGLKNVIDRFPQSLLVLDRNFTIVYHNRQIFNMLPEAPPTLVGYNFELVFGSLLACSHAEFMAAVPLREVVEKNFPLIDIETKTVTGSTYLADYYPILDNSGLKHIVINFRDITHRKEIENESRLAYDELSKAFRLMLPNTQIEKRLKLIPEYQDYFDHNTGLIEITEVIPDGAYLHVINCLRIAAELQEKEVFSINGIDRNTVVQTLILHDLGKQQPALLVGDIADPKACFEKGSVHAERSAGLAAQYDFVTADMINLIRYHHHCEHELPLDFPFLLIPMLRLVKLIDGLSAGMTRRNAELDISLENSVITVFEKNANSLYNGIRELDLLSGQTDFIKVAKVQSE